jgi:thioredoxin-related protein
LVKRIALLAAVALLAGQQAFAAGAWIKSYSAAEQKAKASNRNIFVDLFADWCGWCHKFEQDVIPSEAFQKASDKMVLLRLNTEDGGDGTAFAQKFGVTSLPTFLILAPDSTIVGIVRGYLPPAEFASAMKESEKRYDDFLQRAADEPKFAKDYQKRFDLANEFRMRYSLPRAETRFRTLTTEKGVPVNLRDESFYQLGLVQLLQKKYGDSVATITRFRTVQTKGDAFERSQLLLGDVYMSQGQKDKAIAEYKKFKTMFPNSPLNANVDRILPQLQQGK